MRRVKTIATNQRWNYSSANAILPQDNKTLNSTLKHPRREDFKVFH
jgi:hypothetical protein